MNLKIEITPEEFKALDTQDQKLDVIYSALTLGQGHCEDICDENDKRFKKLHRRKLMDTGLATLFGTVAGFIGGLSRTKIF